MQVALLMTCLADQLFPEVAVAAVRLLRRLGVKVTVPEEQTCCGQPAYNAGYHREARDIAAHHLRVFADADYIVLPSGSCAAMLTCHYPELFSEQPERHREATELAKRSYELCTFVTDVLGVTDVGADLRGLKVVFHDNCHALRGVGIYDAPRRLLRAAGAELLEPADDDACCGFGGLFSVKLPEISAAMARARLAALQASGAEVITSTDAGCLMQLQGALRRQGGSLRVQHVAELLWQGVS
jgi:L-lactate dehydrogenase complex protein LldE